MFAIESVFLFTYWARHFCMQFLIVVDVIFCGEEHMSASCTIWWCRQTASPPRCSIWAYPLQSPFWIAIATGSNVSVVSWKFKIGIVGSILILLRFNLGDYPIGTKAQALGELKSLDQFGKWLAGLFPIFLKIKTISVWRIWNGCQEIIPQRL